MSSFTTYWLLVPLQSRQWLSRAGQASLQLDRSSLNKSTEGSQPLLLLRTTVTLACSSLVNAWKDENDIIRMKGLKRAKLLRNPQ